MGLNGEAGETTDLLKKHLFHGKDLDRKALLGELGDVLWYLTNLAEDFGMTLDQVAENNISKLKKRYPDGFSTEASNNRPEED